MPERPKYGPVNYEQAIRFERKARADAQKLIADGYPPELALSRARAAFGLTADVSQPIDDLQLSAEWHRRTFESRIGERRDSPGDLW